MQLSSVGIIITETYRFIMPLHQNHLNVSFSNEIRF